MALVFGLLSCKCRPTFLSVAALADVVVVDVDVVVVVGDPETLPKCEHLLTQNQLFFSKKELIMNPERAVELVRWRTRK